MNAKPLFIAITAVFLSACATTAPLSYKHNPNAGEARAETAKQAGIGAGIGCALGAVAGLAKGGLDSAAKGCAAGAILGGGIGFAKGLKAQLDQAKALEAEAQQHGIEVQVQTKTAIVEQGKAPVEQLDQLTVTLSRNDIEQGGAKTQPIVVRVATLAAASASPTTIRISGTPTERLLLRTWINGALKAGHKVSLLDADGKVPSLVVSPVPSVGKEGA